MERNDKFAALLKDFRGKSGLRQGDLAAKCDISQTLISQFETGKTLPTAKQLDLLARGLQLGPEEKKRLFLAAGYIEDTDGQVSEIVTRSDFRAVLSLLSDPMLNNLPGPLARGAVTEFADGWHLYAQAKEKQYQREWRGTEDICETAVLKLQRASHQLEAYLYDTMGSAALHRGNFAEAQQRYDHVASLLPRIEDPYLEGQLLVHQGELLRFRSEWRQAEQKFRDAKRAFLNLSNTDSQTQLAWVDKKIGVLYLMQDKWQRALRYLERSEVIFRETGNDYELAKLCIALGWAYTQQGDWHKALQYRLEGYQLSQEHRVMGQEPDDYLRMQGRVYLGLALHQSGYLDQAEKLLEAAKDTSDKLEEMHERSTILVGLAQVYFDKYIRAGQKEYFDITDEYFNIAAEEAQKVGDKYRYARTRLYHSQLYLRPGKVDQAIDHLQEAQRIFRALEHHYYLSTVAILLGRAFLMTERYDNLDVCVIDGAREALVYQYPYYRQLSELRVQKARVHCYNGDLEDATKQLAFALVDAIYFNRFQCEKIADQVVSAIACSDALKKGFSTTWGRQLMEYFEERINRDRNAQELSKKQEKLIENVATWLNELRKKPTTRCPKRAKKNIQSLVEDADLLDL